MKTLLTVLFVFVSICVFAQDYKLVYYKGDVSVAGQKLAVNAVVNNAATVKIGNSSEAIFTNSKKEVVHLRKPGTFSVKNFAWYVVKGDKTSLSGYYLNYIVNQATYHDADPEKHASENLKNVGGVSRGRKPFLVFPQAQTRLIDSIVTFYWNGSDSGAYKWSLVEQNGNSFILVAEGKITGRSTIVNLQKLGANRGRTFKWEMESTDGVIRGEALFYLATENEFYELLDNVIALKTETVAMSSELQAATLAALFEGKGYYLHADEVYQEALSAEPDSEFLKQRYQTFRKNIYGE